MHHADASSREREVLVVDVITDWIAGKPVPKEIGR